jgi:hypothetical protein
LNLIASLNEIAGGIKATKQAFAPTLSPPASGRVLPHLQGQPITCELLALAAQREASQIDEKLFFELFATPSPTQLKLAGRRR